jgi:hypothetical protein
MLPTLFIPHGGVAHCRRWATQDTQTGLVAADMDTHTATALT